MVTRQSVVDRSAVDKLRGIGGDAFTCDMLDRFAKRATELVGRMEDGASRGDPDPIEAAAHNLSSNAGMTGFRELSAAARAAERAAERGDMENAIQEVARIVAMLPQVQRAVLELRAELDDASE